MGTAASASALERYADGDPLAALQFDLAWTQIVAPARLETLVRTTIEQRMRPASPVVGSAAPATPSTTERRQARARQALR